MQAAPAAPAAAAGESAEAAAAPPAAAGSFPITVPLAVAAGEVVPGAVEGGRVGAAEPRDRLGCPGGTAGVAACVGSRPLRQSGIT